MKYLPVGLDLRGRPCVVVGGGSVGTRKVRNLRTAGAAVTLVAPRATPELTRMAEAGEIRWIREEYREELLDGSFLAVAATDNQDLNGRLVDDAKSRRVLVCDASSAQRSQVIFGALHVADGVTIAVFTDGADPTRARQVRDRIAARDGILDGGPTVAPVRGAGPDPAAGAGRGRRPDSTSPSRLADTGDGGREEG